ncbi:MAG: hypothetical protein AAGA70_13190 [Pseudomonadota bacterium]
MRPRRSAVTGFDASTAHEMRSVTAVLEIYGGIAVIADNTWRAIQAAYLVTLRTEPARRPAEQTLH